VSLNASLPGIVITNERGQNASFLWRDLYAVIAFLEQQEEPIPLWRASGEPDSLEDYLVSRGLKPFAGCLADLLVQAGFASQATTPV